MRSTTARSHLLWCPKRRRVLGDADVRAYVTKCFRAIAAEFNFWIDELAVEDDHVHVFLEFLRIPAYVGHRFRSKAATHSGNSRPPIPAQAGHLGSV